MSSKILTSVVVFAVVLPFAFIAINDAVSIKRNLQEQTKQIESLGTQTVKLDQQLTETQTKKEQSEAETKQLEQETADALTERQRLEAELGAF